MSDPFLNKFFPQNDPSFQDHVFTKLGVASVEQAIAEINRLQAIEYIAREPSVNLHIIKSIHSTESGTFVQLKEDVQKAFAFQEQIKKLLGVDSDDEALEKIKDTSQTIYDACTQSSERTENKIKDLRKTIDEVASMPLGFPFDEADSNTVINHHEDLTSKIEYLESELHANQFTFAELRHDLVVAKKVIARLVGE